MRGQLRFMAISLDLAIRVADGYAACASTTLGILILG
jgi:hypothetical protein